MKNYLIGLSAKSDFPVYSLKTPEFIEIKKITPGETSFFRSHTKKPIYFHIQYNGSGGYLSPAVDNFNDYLAELSEAYRIAKPEFVSFHFGLSAKIIHVDSDTFVAMAGSPPLAAEELLSMLEHNLRFSRTVFQESRILLENLEFIPEELSKGAYRYIQEADFLSKNLHSFIKTGMLDGMVLDIAHALVTAANHPAYNGLENIISSAGQTEHFDPVHTDKRYIETLAKYRNDIDILGSFKKYVKLLPVELIKEIHISGIHRLENGVYVDSHNEISGLELDALDFLLDILPADGDDRVSVTLEYDRNPGRIREQLKTLEMFCNDKFSRSTGTRLNGSIRPSFD